MKIGSRGHKVIPMSYSPTQRFRSWQVLYNDILRSKIDLVVKD